MPIVFCQLLWLVGVLQGGFSADSICAAARCTVQTEGEKATNAKHGDMVTKKNESSAKALSQVRSKP